MTLREVADVLDGIAPEHDWSIEKGREYVKHQLEHEHVDITKAAEKPSDMFKPVVIELKEEFQDRLVNHQLRHRPPKEWEQMESQVMRWLAEGKVEKSNSPWNTRHVLAKKRLRRSTG